MSELDLICDMCNQNLKEVPESILKMKNLKMLYLNKNQIIELPQDFFQKLPYLTWLDLRDNELSSIPSGIEGHKDLENLLLQNNKIEDLPNELGSLPKLKVLSLSNNPLTYPPPEIVDQGIDSLLEYLRQQQFRSRDKLRKCVSSSIQSNSSGSSSTLATNANRTESGTFRLELLPSLMEENLSKRILNQRQLYLNNKCSHDKVHKVIKSPSKTSIHSTYKKRIHSDMLPTPEKMNAEQLKEMWLKKIRELLIDQERILQQEKSINAMKKWRKSESMKIKISGDVNLEAPYDTNIAFNSYMTRGDPTAIVEKALVEQLPKAVPQDINTIIQDIMAQLTKAKEAVLEATDPLDKIKSAEHELELIVGLHKKITNIQKSKII